jgi:hypothetical protein
MSKATAAYCSRIQMPGRSLQARLKRHNLQFFKFVTSSTAGGGRPSYAGMRGRTGKVWARLHRGVHAPTRGNP